MAMETTSELINSAVAEECDYKNYLIALGYYKSNNLKNALKYINYALKDLKKLYIGKTMIKDHRRTADNQIARVYETELVQDDTAKLTGAALSQKWIFLTLWIWALK